MEEKTDGDDATTRGANLPYPGCNTIGVNPA
jgi:hypothetical protein